MKYVLGIVCLLVLAGKAFANEEEVLLHINGKSVTKREFTRFCRMQKPEDSSSVEAEELFDRFLFFRLKVADATQCGWDTLPYFKHRCKVAQGKALKAWMLDKDKMDSLSYSLYRKSVEHYLMKGWVKMQENSILLPQNATRGELAAAYNQIDSVYRSLRQGAPLETEAIWYPLAGLLQEFSNHLDGLRKGEYSVPFVSPMGVHIIKLIDYKPAMSYEEASPYLSAYIGRMGKCNPALKQNVYTRWRDNDWGHTPEGFYMQAIKDSLLAALWDTRHSLLPTDNETELEHHFETHKKDYVWEFPHYKGAVILCQDKKTVSRIRKRLKKLPMEQWEKAFHTWLETYPTEAAIQVGLFQIGTNAYVDKLAFNCGKLPQDSRYPHACVIGKHLKKGPETYKDVQKQVEQDYLRTQKKQQVAELKQRFKIEISQDVLKTVNYGGNILIKTVSSFVQSDGNGTDEKR